MPMHTHVAFYLKTIIWCSYDWYKWFLNDSSYSYARWTVAKVLSTAFDHLLLNFHSCISSRGHKIAIKNYPLKQYIKLIALMMSCTDDIIQWWCHKMMMPCTEDVMHWWCRTHCQGLLYRQLISPHDCISCPSIRLLN